MKKIYAKHTIRMQRIFSALLVVCLTLGLAPSQVIHSAQATVPTENAADTTLKPAIAETGKPIETIRASIENAPTGRIALHTKQQILTSLTDAEGNVINAKDTTITYSAQPEGIVEIDNNGTVQTLKKGAVTITVRAQTAGNPAKTAEIKATVAEDGDNLLVNSNPGFETNEWIWDIAQNTPTDWRSLSIDQSPSSENPKNRALKVAFNKDIAAKAQSAFAYKGGKRVKIKTGRFYELSFKVKIQDLVKPANATGMIAIIPDMYAFNQVSGGSLAGLTYRNLEIHKIKDYEDKFSDWVRVSLEIAAPIDEQTAPKLEYVYATPRLSITTSNSGMNNVTGYGGTIWFDDFELREVGFDHVELTREGELVNTGDKAVYTIKPVATTGNKIDIAAVAVPKAVKMMSSDSMIASVTAARPTVAGNNLLPTIADVSLQGKNGTATVTAEVTLNGVTRSATNEVTVSGQPIILYSANLALSKPEASVGETIKATASAMMTDGTPANLKDAVVLYYSKNEDVAEINPVTGEIKPLKEGTTEISTSVKMNGVVKNAKTTLKVIDTSALKSAKLKVEKTQIGMNDTMQIGLEGMMESGNPANFASATVKYIIQDGDANVKIDDKGVLTGLAIGTATIKAEVTLRGVTITTVPLTITVVKGIPQPFGINLTDKPLGDPKKLATNEAYQDYGWAIDQEKTDPAIFTQMRYQLYGIQFQSHVGQNLVFKFRVPQDGNYAFTITGGNYKAGTTNAEFYVDGSYIGSYNFYNVNNNVAVGPKATMKAIPLTAGDHTLTLHPKQRGPEDANMYPGVLQFVGLEQLPEITALNIAAENADLSIGEKTKMTASYTTSDGHTFEFKKRLDGTDDPQNKVSYTSSKENVFTIDAQGNIEAKGLGNAEVIAQVTINGTTTEKRIPITVSNKIFTSVSAKLADTPLYVGQTTTIRVEPKFDNGNNINLNLCKIDYSADTTEFIDLDNKGTITAKKAGTTKVTVNVTFKDVTKTAVLDVTVENTRLKDVIVSADKTYLKPTDDSAQITVTGRDNLGKLFDITGATYHYTSSNDSVVFVSETGTAIPVGLGNATVTVDVEYKGQKLQGKIDFVITEGKTKSTYYTEEKIAAARENIKKYSWAREQCNEAVKNAEKYVGQEEHLWNLVTQEGLPRGITVGFQNDPNAYTCAYCGCDIRAKYYAYGWISEPLQHPWKVRCPDCRRLFPSNDFEKFYQLGIDENGKFNHALAHERNAELVAKGEDGYLKNILYPEKDVDGVVNWGVDDGFGYRTGKTFSNGVDESKTWIAYYIHYGLWETSKPEYNPGLLQNALLTLRDAYLFTGDIRYGRTGAILIDRVADVYPDFDLAPYSADPHNKFYNSHGGGGEGKILGRIWETGLARNLVYAYDAFYPVMDDPYVISFLNQKAEKYNIPNKKTSAKQIRENGADGILRTVFDAAKKAQIYGNFGMHQAAVANAAIVHDTMPETAEWIDWIYQDGKYSQGKCTGGNVNAQLVDQVNRDAMGNEAAPGYNIGWLTNTTNIAEAMYGYDKYPAANLYENPKFKKMFTSMLDMTLVGRNTAQIGDSGGTAGIGLVMSTTSTILGFQRLGDPLLAQATYQLNGNSFDDLHASIFTKNPEEVIDQMDQIVKERGPLSFGSKYLGGEGFAILRSGEYRDATNQGDIVDTQRDFWIRNGRTAGHGHPDALNLGIEAYGINMAPELGYPEATGSDPNRIQWINTGISHNTVTVDLTPASGIPASGKTEHFDDSGRVKLMDLSHDAYLKNYQDSIYRRTLVMIDASDEVSYGIDFFRVKGGKDHLYSFHSQSNTVAEVEGLKTRDQKRAVDIDADGNAVYEWVGSYAGVDVPWGVDTAPNANKRYGTTWLEHIRKDSAPKGMFSVDYKIDDFRNVLPYDMDLHMRVTMLNNDLSEVTLAKGTPPRVRGNPSKLEYLIARRTGTQDLDTLFTTVYEPYKGERYIQKIEEIKNTSVDMAKSELINAHQENPEITNSTVIHLKSGTPGANDVVRAVKVTLHGGRVDYVLYSTNNNVMYTVTELNIAEDNGKTSVTEKDVFDYRGFVGVHTVVNEKPVYSYLNDGDTLGDVNAKAAVTGTVTGFTKELSEKNSITIKPDESIDPMALNGKYIVIQNDGVESGTYEILHAKSSADGSIELDIGDVTPIRAYKDNSTAFVYNIAEGQNFRIPLSMVKGNVPIFTPISECSVEVGSELKFQVNATGESGNPLSYSATSLPRGANFDPETRTFTWVPDSAQVGKHHATFKAVDQALESTMTVNIKVYNRSGGPSGPITPPNPDDGKLQKEEILFDALVDQEVSAKGKLGAATFPAGTFHKNGKGKLTIEKDGTKLNLRVSVDGKPCTTDQFVKISIAYSPDSTMKNHDCIVIRDPSGTILPTSRFDNGKITFYTNQFGAYTIVYHEKIFTDIANYPWAKEAILRLAARDIIHGITSSTYAPEKNITRADFTLLMVRMLGLKAKGTSGFTDVPADAYYAEAIAAAKEHGIVGGVSTTQFAPSADISRQDMMLILARVLKIEGSVEVLLKFSDANEISDYARSAVAAMTEKGYVAGANGKVHPKGCATRAEVAVILDRILLQRT